MDAKPSEARYVVFDTELTGLDERKNAIVSIGAVRMMNGKIDLADSFHRLVKPKNGLTWKSIVIHGITPSEVEEEQDIAAVLTEFARYCGSDPVVGYCVDIDLAFLKREAARVSLPPVTNQSIDVVPLYEWLGSRGNAPCGSNALTGRYRLQDMARAMGISANGAHNALIDAYITAQVFQRLLPSAAASGIESLGGLIRAAGKFRGGDRNTAVLGMCNF